MKKLFLLLNELFPRKNIFLKFVLKPGFKNKICRASLLKKEIIHRNWLSFDLKKAIK